MMARLQYHTEWNIDALTIQATAAVFMKYVTEEFRVQYSQS